MGHVQTLVAVCALVAVSPTAVAQQELFSNAGFESPLTDDGHWESRGFVVTRSSDAHSGQHSLKCTGRLTSHFQGPAQLVTLIPLRLYKVQAFIKQLNEMPGKFFQVYRTTVAYSWSDNDTNINVAFQSAVRSADGWFRLTGFFRAPSAKFLSSMVKFHGPDVSIDFLLDDASLVEIPDNGHNWRQEADLRIQQLRMGDIRFRLTLPPHVQSSEIEVQIDHKKHAFSFGTLVRDQWLTDSNHARYQQTVYDLFNAATTQALKWLYDRGPPGHPDYHIALTSIAELKKHGMLVRAHNLFWGVPKYLPDYVQHYASLSQLNSLLQEHFHYMVNITKGQVDHWDVVNELLHSTWFEEQFHDSDFSQDWYRQLHQLDPKPLLMINEYEILARQDAVDAYLQQAQKFLAQGVPLHGLGIQSHFKTEVLDPSLIKLFLDHLSQAGLPLWVTELDVYNQDVHARADDYETALRLFFSHPAVHGVILWGFWDHHLLNPTSSLADGPDVTLNEAGLRYRHLIKEEWSTHVNKTLTSGPNVVMRGFKGDYEVLVRRNGAVIKTVHFSLNGTEATVLIDLNDSGHSGNTPPGVDQDAQRDSNGAYVLGNSSSSSGTSGLTCANRFGGVSDVADEAAALSSCRNAGEVMTGCSSILKNHDWHREGEQITADRSGHVDCRAVDGVGTTGGVQAVARCCSLSALTCTYRASGPSAPGVGNTVEVQCLPGETVLGCSSWGPHNNGGGVRASHSSCSALNNDPHSGVNAYAVCCSAPGLACVTVTSLLGATDHVVSCPHGYSLTGCNFFTAGGTKAAGASLSGDGSCRAFAAGSLGDGQSIQAQAICCTV